MAEGDAKSITVRNIPADTHRKLAVRAAQAGKSLQEYLRAELVDSANKETVDEFLARLRARKEQFGTELSVEQILAHRDADRK